MKANEKKCPQCAEIIKLDALVCKHCGHTFDADDVATQKEKVKKNKQIGCGAAIGLLLLVGYCASKTPNTQTGSNETAAVDGSPAAQGGTTGTSETKPDSKWAYSSSLDEMRKTTTRFATITSENEVEFDFPYNGGSNLEMQLRQRPEDGFQILITISKGQFLCNSFSNTTIAVKFDDGPVKKFGCSDTSSGDSNTLFVERPATFLKSLRGAKRVMIEPQFFQEAGRQFTFDVRGLVWK